MNIKHLLSGLFIVSLLGCASFSKNEFRKYSEPLTKENLSRLNGNYSYYPIKRFGEIFENYDAESIKYANSYQGIINESREAKKKYDSILKNDSYYSISLKLIDNEKLHVSLKENGTKIRDTIFKGKLKNNMFYIDNNYLKCTGIPYLFGKCENNKRRIGLTENNNLIINEAVSNEGAILIILGGGHRYNASFEYERIN